MAARNYLPRRDAPAWLREEFDRERIEIYAERRRTADAVEAIAARLLAEEPTFIGAIVRQYAADRFAALDNGTDLPPPCRRPERSRAARIAERMKLAAWHRGRGLSIRQIAEHLRVSAATVHADLARWDAARAETSPLPFRNGVQAAGSPPAGLNTGPERAATVTPIRRSS